MNAYSKMVLLVSTATLICLVFVLGTQSNGNKKQTVVSSFEMQKVKKKVEIMEPEVKDFTIEVGLNGKMKVFANTAVAK